MPLRPDYVNSRGVAAPKGHFIPISALVRQSWPPQNTNETTKGAIAAAVTNGFKTTVLGPNTATVTYKRTTSQLAGGTVFDGSLATGSVDYPRNVVITVTHASAVVALSGVINGLDAYGRNISEAWSVSTGTTSKTFTGAKAFCYVDNITVVSVADASADSVIIGTGNVMGFKCFNSCASAVKEQMDSGLVTNGTLVIGSHSNVAADFQGTYSPSTAPNGTHTYDVWFISDQPELT